MRIGELAALAGVTTRTVRHYHRIGLLPEPARRVNGYRDYGLRAAVELTRIRRLTELGLGLDEVRDVLADDAGKDLHEVLAELDADLARQEEAIRSRRARLAELLAQAEAGGGLPAEAPVSPELATLFAEMARTSAELPGPEPAMAVRERELLALLDTTGTPEARSWLSGLLQSMAADPGAMRRAYAVYALMDELAGAAVDDPRVAEAARAIADSVPDEVAASIDVSGEDLAAAGGAEGGFMAAFFEDHAPAQAEAVRQAILLMRERAR
ncbi:MerR family transcriptional regulator [Streptomyces sp. NPDC005722]